MMIMNKLTRPHSNANGFSRPKNEPLYFGIRKSLNSNGTPCNKLPNATPKISGGTKPLIEIAISHD
jgi:hypothetical protein